MYCINCGVKLADTEKKCPLCDTVVCHPDFEQKVKRPSYPSDRLPKSSSGSKVLCGAVIIMFLIPLFICFFADLLYNNTLNWFGYVAGALVVAYVAFALPLWFRKPNPVIFVPCNFVSAMLYILYIENATGGDWFLCFALPVAGGIGIITCAVVTLLHYLRRGRLYVVGGAFMALGMFMLLIEYLMCVTFGLGFIGWSIFPLVALFLIGGLLIYFAINSSAREVMERKLFF